jgi:glycine/serine hydroxymethyltransferase
MKVLHDIDNPAVKANVKAEVKALCSRFPVPGIKS